MKYIKNFLFIVVALLLAVSAQAQTITGKVTHVYDGDTIKIKDSSGAEHNIRFYGIDAPETEQDYGSASKQFVSKKTYNKNVKIKVYDVDRYGRTVGVVFVGSTNVNKRLLENGLAWQYSQYCKESFCDNWKNIEEHARLNEVGLWAETNPTPPWNWRKENKKGNNFGDFLKELERLLKIFLKVIDKVEEILNML